MSFFTAVQNKVEIHTGVDIKIRCFLHCLRSDLNSSKPTFWCVIRPYKTVVLVK